MIYFCWWIDAFTCEMIFMRRRGMCCRFLIILMRRMIGLGCWRCRIRVNWCFRCSLRSEIRSWCEIRFRRFSFERKKRKVVIWWMGFFLLWSSSVKHSRILMLIGFLWLLLLVGWSKRMHLSCKNTMIRLVQKLVRGLELWSLALEAQWVLIGIKS